MQSATTFHPVQDCEEGVVNTVSGQLINLRNPSPKTITIADIANSLSKICRFGGHTNAFYSVAQHCVLVAAMCEHFDIGAHYGKEGLLHDASEAYLGDVIKPLKIILGETYNALEREFEAIIDKKFALRTDRETMAAIKHFDIVALHLEHLAFQQNKPAKLIENLEKFNLLIEDQFAWNCKTANAMFLAAYSDYFEL